MAVNALAYIITLVIFFRKSGLSVGTCIWGAYTVSAIGAVFFIMQPDFEGTIHDMPFRSYEGLIYLFICLLLCISPLTLLRKAVPGKQNFTHPQAIKWLMIFSIFIQLIFIFVDLKNAEGIIGMNQELLADVREELYEENLSGRADGGLVSKLDFLFGSIPYISFGISIYLILCYDRLKLLSCALLVVTLACLVESVLVSVSRGAMVINLMYAGILLIYLRDFMSKKLKAIIVVYLLPVLGVMFAFFWAISVSRFGDLANFMIFKYLGEPMVNFAGNLYPVIDGHTEGVVNFPHFHKLLTGTDIPFADTRAKWDYVEAHTGVQPHIFYTFIGALVIDFGFPGAFILALVCFFCCRKIARGQHNLSLGTMFGLIFFIYMYSAGVFFMVIQASIGVFMIIYTIFLSWYFKTHESRRHNLPSRT